MFVNFISIPCQHFCLFVLFLRQNMNEDFCTIWVHDNSLNTCEIARYGFRESFMNFQEMSWKNINESVKTLKLLQLPTYNSIYFCSHASTKPLLFKPNCGWDFLTCFLSNKLNLVTKSVLIIAFVCKLKSSL